MYYFIINPFAGNGKALQVFEKLQKTDLFQGLDSVYYFTEYEGHAEELAASIKGSTKIKRLVVIGGDGTIHEVLNGIGETDLVIGFIPGGSGNDFARGAGIKGKPEDILRVIVDGKNIRNYWLGEYKHDEEKERYFINSIGFGFDAQTAHTANHAVYKQIFNRLKVSTFSYVIALLQILSSFKYMDLEITIDGEKRYVRNCFLLSIGNHPYYGGGMKVMPNAKVQPNKFAVFLVQSVPKWKVLTLFLTVFRGAHEKIKGVELFEAETLMIKANAPIYTQVDGQTKRCQTAIMKKQSKAVQIITTENEI